MKFGSSPFGSEISVSATSYAPINVKPAGGRRSIGRDFDIFPKKLLSNSVPPGKNVRSNITEIPRPGNDLWSRAQTKILVFAM